MRLRDLEVATELFAALGVISLLLVALAVVAVVRPSQAQERLEDLASNNIASPETTSEVRVTQHEPRLDAADLALTSTTADLAQIVKKNRYRAHQPAPQHATAPAREPDRRRRVCCRAGCWPGVALSAVIELALCAGEWVLNLIGVRLSPPRARPGRHRVPARARKRCGRP